MELCGFWLLLANVAGWLIIQMSIVYLLLKTPDSFLDHSSWLFRAHSWERKGALY